MQNRAAKFNAAITKLCEQYPDHIIDVWMPMDFQGLTSKKLTKKDHINIVEHILHHADANYGINWETITDSLSELGLLENKDE